MAFVSPSVIIFSMLEFDLFIFKSQVKKTICILTVRLSAPPAICHGVRENTIYSYLGAVFSKVHFFLVLDYLSLKPDVTVYLS